jgi:anti-sigma B factor antagonist
MVSHRQDAVEHVWLSGRITIDSSPELRLILLQRLESPDCRGLILDLFDVTYIDTSGLAILVELLKAAKSLGKTCWLSRLSDRPRYLLEATRLLDLFNVVDGANPGVNSFAVEASL